MLSTHPREGLPWFKCNGFRILQDFLYVCLLGHAFQFIGLQYCKCFEWARLYRPPPQKKNSSGIYGDRRLLVILQT